MHATSRIPLLCLLAALAWSAAADSALDDTIHDHVLPRFDREARALAADTGARFVSSRWEPATRTLVSVADMPAPTPRRMSVAFPSTTRASRIRLVSEHLERLCAHPAAGLIERFLAEHGITMTFVYTRALGEPLVISMNHEDLAACH